MDSQLNKIAKNKLIGLVLVLFSLIGFGLFFYRLTHYVYEYDPKYSPYDYGPYNILSYFTVQTNFFAYVYLLLAGLSILGLKATRKIAFNETLKILVTLYVVIAGVTYCAGFPLGMTPPLKWDSFTHGMSSFIQVYYHMIMPVLFVILLYFPFRKKPVKKKAVYISAIYPFVYSIFSIIRGRIIFPPYYPYPFYNPINIWNIFAKGKPMNHFVAYFVMFILLAIGISIFMAVANAMKNTHNKRYDISEKKKEKNKSR